MPRLRTLMPAVVVATIGALALGGCASTAPVELGEAAVVIDVRTPQEFAEGHLDGAVNVDLNSGAFEQRIAEFDTAGEYAVYCRSGNRSGQAAQIMDQLGFENVSNLGGVQDASRATGLPVVQ